MRRTNGTGCVFRADNGTYTAVANLGYVGDKRIRKWKRGFTTKRDAIIWLERTEFEMPKENVSQLWETYLLTDYKNLSEEKQRHYLTVYERLKPIWNKPIDKLSILDLQHLIEPYSSFYAQKDIKTVLSHIYNIAMAQQMVSVNLTQFLKLNEHTEKESKTWTKDEIEKFWDAYENGDKFVGYILFMTYSGTMPAELRNINRSMINYETHEILGAGMKTEVRKKAPIIIADKIVPVLQSLMADSLVLWKGTKTEFYGEYERCLKRLGVEYKPPYTCRHTCATLLVSDTDALITQKVMRHSRVTTTQRYIHPDSETLLKAVNKI